MHTAKSTFILAAALAAMSTTALAQSNTFGSGNADNSNAIVNGSRNSQVMERGVLRGPTTGSGHADNTNSTSANRDDFMLDRSNGNSRYVDPALEPGRGVYRRDVDRAYVDRPNGVPYTR